MVIVQEVGERPFLDQKGGMAAAVPAFLLWQSEADLRKPAEGGSSAKGGIRIFEF